MEIDQRIAVIKNRLRDAEEKLEATKRITRILAPLFNSLPENSAEKPIQDSTEQRDFFFLNAESSPSYNTSGTLKGRSSSPESRREIHNRPTGRKIIMVHAQRFTASEVEDRVAKARRDIRAEAEIVRLIGLHSGDDYEIKTIMQNLMGGTDGVPIRNLKIRNTPYIINMFNLNHVVNQEYDKESKNNHVPRKYVLHKTQKLGRKEIYLLAYAICYYEAWQSTLVYDAITRMGLMLYFLKNWASVSQEPEMFERSLKVLYANGYPENKWTVVGEKLVEFFDEQEQDFYIEYIETPIVPKRIKGY